MGIQYLSCTSAIVWLTRPCSVYFCTCSTIFSLNFASEGKVWKFSLDMTMAHVNSQLVLLCPRKPCLSWKYYSFSWRLNFFLSRLVVHFLFHLLLETQQFYFFLSFCNYLWIVCDPKCFPRIVFALISPIQLSYISMSLA